MLNTVALGGNVTRPPELTATASGTPILHVGIAVNEPVKDRETGEWKTRPDFFDLVMFGKRAASLHPHIRKGQKIFVQGRLRYSSWENSEGQRRSKVEVVIEDLEFAGGPQRKEEDEGAEVSPAVPGPPAADVYDADIPF